MLASLMLTKRTAKEIEDHIKSLLYRVGFAREVADRVLFMEEGELLVSDTPENIFGSAKHSRLQQFLSKIL
ncbi:hypothetical protein [Photobacterium sp.]|uniref:hypothetical protein n=1 Tax=Photobacterium sp. TaxID=660 RepID=UPI00299E89A7|nr:hypothetical protein [Photobacterium sp.]MDX1300780.1 hypothetical protein [Photobacterium sp.]